MRNKIHRWLWWKAYYFLKNHTRAHSYEWQVMCDAKTECLHGKVPTLYRNI